MKIKLLCLSLLLSNLVFSQTQGPELHIRKTAQAVKIDGSLDEAVWQTAEAAAVNRRCFPVDTGFSQWPCEVRLAFDETYLYLGATVFQKSDDYTVQSLKRDFPGGTSDVFNILLDPAKDGQNGFIFGVSPLGSQREALISNGQDMAFEWDNRWFSAVQNFPDRWTVEMAIPFKTLRYNVSEGLNTWRLNFVHPHLKPWEVSVWSPVPVQFFPQNLAFCGTLIWDDAPPRTSGGVSLIPYLNAGYSVSYDRDQTTQELLDTPSKFTKGVGGDAKIALSSGLNLDLTINPDFSQVEVDQQVANLQRFELFFPERRQFFLENRDLFAMFGFPSTRPFFWRRVGLSRNPITLENETVPILAGARLSGKLTDKWRIGLLDMQTEQKRWSADRVLPAANFLVATAQRKMFGRSALSAVLVNKQNFLGDLQPSETGGAQPWNRVAGLEYNLYSQDNRWEGEWYYHRSFSADGTKDDHSFAHFLVFTDKKWSARLGYLNVGKKYDSEAGFITRRGVQQMFPGASYFFWPNSQTINNFRVGVGGDMAFDLNMNPLDRTLRLEGEANFKNLSLVTVGVYRDFIHLLEPLDPTHLDGVEFPVGSEFSNTGVYADYVSSSSYDWQVTATAKVAGFFNGSLANLEGFVSYRLQPIGLFSMGYSFNRIRLPEPYTSADVVLLGPKAELSFTRNFFASAFVQYNTQANNLNVNARLQWRFAPVSDVFLVYTENSFAERIEQTGVRFLTPKNRAVVLKVVYWLNV